MRYLRGNAKIETVQMVITADNIDYDSDTGLAHARGHVHLLHYATGDQIDADHADYNLRTQEGRFYHVSGTAPAKPVSSPGVLTTTNPFYFEAEWADRKHDRYILHHGFLTDCKRPSPWWVFQSPTFDVIPANRAIAHSSIFRLKMIPLFYLPYYYRPLGKKDRASGFLTPEIGNSSLYGQMYGGGYYWAMNRSYDMTGTVRYFSDRGPAITYNFRGDPTQKSNFSFNLYDVIDRGAVEPSGAVQKQGGYDLNLTGHTEIAGFVGNLNANYLSSLIFREAFSNSFTGSIYNETDSTGYLQRRFDNDTSTLTFVGQRNQIFEGVTNLSQKPNEIVLQKLPATEYSTRDRPLFGDSVPVWWSLDSSAGLLSRVEPSSQLSVSGASYGSPLNVYNTGAYSRFDFEPHIESSYSWAGFTIAPGATLGATEYGDYYSQNTTTYGASCNGFIYCPDTQEQLAHSNLFRKDADFTVRIRTPEFERVFTPQAWLHLGAKVKHAIDADVQYEYVTGINNLQRIIRFDETDILSNTNQATFTVTNRLYKKDKKGNVSEFLTWRVAQARYFDPTFGGAILSPAIGSIVDATRNVLFSEEEFSPYPFLDGPRTYSPVSSTLTMSPYSFFSLDWRTDYDPRRQKFVDQAYSGTFRRKNYFATVSQTSITTNPLLVPAANQISFGGGYGSSTRRGWNVAASAVRDVIRDQMLFEFVQATYNTDCCGYSFQLRHINFGIRNENQYLFSFSLANIGTFGSMQKQDKLF